MSVKMISAAFAAAFAVASASSSSSSSSSSSPIVVDAGYLGGASKGPTITPAKQFAVFVCSGLYNRDGAHGRGVYTLKSGEDVTWMGEIMGLQEGDVSIVSFDAFLEMCMSESGPAKGYIRYNYTAQQVVVPELVTVAAQLDAVPLEDTDEKLIAGSTKPKLLDAVEEWKGFSALDASNYIFDRYVNETTGLSKMNPGLDVHHHPINPKIVGNVDLGLADFIVKRKLFNFFLNDGCIPFTKEHAFVEKLVSNNPWPRPITVWGYDDTWGVEGDPFEAETNCNSLHNMGQVASNGFNNLAYFTRTPEITEPLLQLPDPKVTYNKSKTYIALFVGDGDNMNFMKGSRKTWFDQRLAACGPNGTKRVNGTTCSPLVWTSSPRLREVAPDMIRWYFNASYKTGADYFSLPPSGDLYAYPSEMKGDVQTNFVANTENSCRMYNTSATVTWDWTLWWQKGIDNYFPKYSKNGITRGFVAVNVPFMLPIFAFKKDEFYKVLGENSNVVLFKPREWRGADGKAHEPLSKKNYLTRQEMADEISGYPPGTVTALYTTSDGGFQLADLMAMVDLLKEHVEVVNQNVIVDMALAARAR